MASSSASFHSHRLLLLSDGSAVGVFAHSLSFVYVALSPCAAFAHITDTNATATAAAGL
jgi:hypothetical protein